MPRFPVAASIVSSPCSASCPGRQLRLPRLCRRISGVSYIDLHQHPELSLHEEKTAAKIRQAGFEVTTGIGGTGGVGVLKNGDDPSIHSSISMSVCSAANRE